MRVRSQTIALLAAFAFALAAVACGDDDAEDAETGAETTDEESSDEGSADADGAGDGDAGDGDSEASAAGDPSDPCTLVTTEDFESALGVSISEGEDVSDRFTIGGPEVDSPACQWEATTSGDGVAISVYSVELVTADDADGQLYADLIENAEFFDAEVSDLDVGDEAVGIVEDGDSPEILARAGDVFMKLSTASDDLTVDDLLPLAEAAVSRVDAG